MNDITPQQEILYRTVAIYVAEGLVGIILFLVFFYFSRIYQRRFLANWALSWIALAIFAFSSAWITFSGIPDSSGTVRFMVSLVSIFGCFSHVALVLLGSFELALNRVAKRNQLLLYAALILLLSFCITLFKNETDGAGMIRYLVRIGVKNLVVAIGFFVAGWLIFFSPQFTRGLGQKFLAGSFLLLGLVDLYYAVLVFSNFFGATFRFPFFFGHLELIAISIIGISMVAWLLEDERAKLQKANTEMDSFLYSTSHDLRAPIASILGLTNLAKVELTDETALKYFEMVENRVNKMDMVISDILQLARSTKAELRLEQIDFNKLLQDVIADVKFNKGAKEIRLEYTPSPSHQFVSDYNQAKIILGNLIGNAVKYHHHEQADPFIAVRFNTTSSEIVIEVEDNGPGIAKQHQEKIFNMFYRASTQSDGTGLGLYIVKEAVNKLRGSIVLTSERDKGSIFKVRLPRAKQ